MKYFFVADFHLGHPNIIEYANRPFKTLEEMNETIIRRHNERVKPEDTVYFLGDFCIEGVNKKAEDYFKQLNGRFVFCGGNHDNNNSLRTITEAIVLHAGGKQILCVHDPFYASDAFELNLCGHVHDAWKYKWISDKSLVINVGVDVRNFYPVSLDEILKEETMLRKRKLEENKNEERKEKAVRNEGLPKRGI